MSDGHYCSYCGGKCQFNNSKECPGKSVLNHCDVLKAKYKGGQDDTDLREAVQR